VGDVKRRAKPLSAEQRRRAIVQVTLPLLERDGFAVSTKQIADAAGIAEGTIFRVFRTKEDLLRATLHAYLDPAEMIERLAQIPNDLPLDTQVRAILDTIRDSASRIQLFMMALRHPSSRVDNLESWASVVHGNSQATATGQSQTGGDCEFQRGGGIHQMMNTQARVLRETIADRLASHADQLTIAAPAAATYLVMLALSSVMTATALPLSHDDLMQLALAAITRSASSTQSIGANPQPPAHSSVLG
jgi:AcrR family transcriptional regulator